MDEFGRGTLENEGLALLAGAVRMFLKRKDLCPHVIVTTHYQKLCSLLPQGPIVDHLRMAYSRENGVLLNLFKIERGISTSFAFDIAADLGLDEDVVARARSLFGSDSVEPLASSVKYPNLPKTAEEETEFLLSLNIPELDD